MRAIRLLGLATVATSPGSATAQGAFNMGGLTGTLSQDAVTQSEEARRPARAARTEADAPGAGGGLLGPALLQPGVASHPEGAGVRAPVPGQRILIAPTGDE